MPKSVTTLFIGDIVGDEGLGVVRSFLPSLIQKHKADFVIANGENSHEGHGINDSIIKELGPINERAKKYIESPELVQSIIGEGCEKARKIARDTMRDVREVMGISF